MRCPLEQHSIGQRLDDADHVDPARHADRQALASELVDQCHERTAIAG